ncbi:MAG: hypothetical protein SAK29_22040 [Scytonema sp. PMC 1069.18]|nr:hypothetical protein [Scytonema sp. PMC 1069.18]MEC4882411.1 hypothetical protein [Scytonema sp. PMC 1070.18]
MQVVDVKDVERPDIVALDKEGQVVLIVKVKGFPFDFNKKKTRENAILELKEYLKATHNQIPFAMLVDLEKIFIFHWDGNQLSEPLLCLNTGDVLSHYEPEFKNKQIFSLYLIGLTEAWLRDLAYHWKTQVPSASKEMAEIGLFEMLEEGTTQAWFAIVRDIIY